MRQSGTVINDALLPSLAAAAFPRDTTSLQLAPQRTGGGACACARGGARGEAARGAAGEGARSLRRRAARSLRACGRVQGARCGVGVPLVPFEEWSCAASADLRSERRASALSRRCREPVQRHTCTEPNATRNNTRLKCATSVPRARQF